MAGRGTDIILEMGLDRQITINYTQLVGHLLDDGAGVVTLKCPTNEAAEVLLSAVSAIDLGIGVVTTNKDRSIAVVVKAHDRSTHGRKISINFGLGLLVIGAEASDNARVDRQLMGRSGRQGAFGASQFFLSTEDCLLKDAGPASSALADTGIDSAGRTFLEGAPLNRHLEKLQTNAERDAESRRARIEEYTRVFEAQSFAYYRSRKEILFVEDWQAFLDGLLAKKAAQLSQKYFAENQVDDYSNQFSDLSEELYLDYNISAASLRGVDINLIEDGIAELLNERLDQTRGSFTCSEFSKLSTLLYLQTSDELWKEHISYVQSLILSTQLCGTHGRGDMAEFTLTSFESYELFQTRIVDSFLPRLAGFSNPPTGGPQPASVELFQDVTQILA
jgi:preprotein translocase subunit SecA